MDEVRRILSRRVGEDYYEVWQLFRDVGTREGGGREVHGTTKEIRLNGRQINQPDALARLKGNTDPGADELRRFLT